MSSIWDFFGHLFNEITYPPTSITIKASNYINHNLTAAQIAALIGTPATVDQQYPALGVEDDAAR